MIDVIISLYGILWLASLLLACHLVLNYNALRNIKTRVYIDTWESIIAIFIIGICPTVMLVTLLNEERSKNGRTYKCVLKRHKTDDTEILSNIEKVWTYKGLKPAYALSGKQHEIYFIRKRDALFYKMSG